MTCDDLSTVHMSDLLKHVSHAPFSCPEGSVGSTNKSLLFPGSKPKNPVVKTNLGSLPGVHLSARCLTSTVSTQQVTHRTES